MKRRIAFFKAASFAIFTASVSLSGCAADDSKPELTEAQKQDQALQHPDSYKQTVGDTSAADDNITNTNNLGKDLHDLFFGP
jgi:hypothetical protein